MPKKITSLTISFLLIFQLLTYKDVYANTKGNNTNVISEVTTDITAPVFKAVNYSSDKVKAGESIDIYVEATDTESGIYGIDGHIAIGDSQQYVTYEYDTTTEKYKCTITTDSSMVYKTLSIMNITIRDNNMNSITVDKSTIGEKYINITDTNGSMVYEPSKLNGVTYSKTELSIGDTLSVYVDTTDPLAGIKEVIGSFNIANNYQDLSFQYDDIGGKYKADILITEEMKYNFIKLEALRITNNEDTTKKYDSYYFDDRLIYLKDSNGNLDRTAPSINSIEINSKTVKVGDKITILVDTEDTVSGIKSVIMYFMDGDSYGAKYLQYDSSLKKYKYEATVPENMEWKTYSLQRLIIYDNANNVRNLEYKTEYDITVSNAEGVTDKDLPIIDNIAVDKNTAAVGDKIKITANISDTTSGIESAYLYYNSDILVNLQYNSEIGKYEGVLNITSDITYQQLLSSGLIITDYAGNRLEKYGEALSNLTINIPQANGVIDTEAPIITSMVFDKLNAKPGEEVKVIAEVQEDKTGIKSFKVELYDDIYGSSYSLDLQYNEASKKYEGSFMLYYDIAYTEIYIYYVSVEDNANNYSDIYYNCGDFATLKVTDSQGNIDNEKPSLIGFSMLKNNVSIDGMPAIKLNIKDKLSYIKNIYIKGETLSGKEYKTVITPEYTGSGDFDICAYLEANNFFYEKVYIKSITIYDSSGNYSEYTSANSDFSNMYFSIGSYMENQYLNIKNTAIYYGEDLVTGQVALLKDSASTIELSNIKAKVYNLDRDDGKLQVIAETNLEADGTFKLKVDTKYSDEYWLVEFYNTNTGELMGYKKIDIFKSTDINEDGATDISDIASVALYYGQGNGEESDSDDIYYSDITNDYFIDLYDLTAISWVYQ